MPKIAKIAIPIVASLVIALTNVGGTVALACEGRADLQPYGGQAIPGASAQGEVELAADGQSGHIELEVSGLASEATYYVNTLDKDGTFSTIGSFTTDVAGNGSFEVTLTNGVSRVGVAVVGDSTADADHVLSTYDPNAPPGGPADRITWDVSDTDADDDADDDDADDDGDADADDDDDANADDDDADADDDDADADDDDADADADDDDDTGADDDDDGDEASNGGVVIR